MEDKELTMKMDKKVILDFGNFPEWYMSTINSAKGKNRDLENLLSTNLEPRFTDPDPEQLIGGRRVYPEDKFGYLKYEADWKDNRERKKKFSQALP